MYKDFNHSEAYDIEMLKNQENNYSIIVKYFTVHVHNGLLHSH